MAYKRTIGELPVLRDIPACVHLRSKAMYVTGELDPLREMDGADLENLNCWCNKTQHTIGPNNDSVGRLVCIEGRECYVAR